MMCRMDWTGCELVEVIPGKVSGAPLVVGTRIPAEVILKNLEAGSPLEEIEENYPALNKETKWPFFPSPWPAVRRASREGSAG